MGPVTAEKILEYREEKGYFNSIEDLKHQWHRRKDLENMKDKISVD